MGFFSKSEDVLPAGSGGQYILVPLTPEGRGKINKAKQVLGVKEDLVLVQEALRVYLQLSNMQHRGWNITCKSPEGVEYQLVMNLKT